MCYGLLRTAGEYLIVRQHILSHCEDCGLWAREVFAHASLLLFTKHPHFFLFILRVILIYLTPVAHNISKRFSSSNVGRFFADDSELRTICGSPLYVAPEILDIGMNLETVRRKVLIS